MTPLETSLFVFVGSILAGSGVKIWDRRNSVSPEQCRKNHKQEENKIDRLEGKINDLTMMTRSLVTHTIEDKDKQEEILNKNGGSGP